MPEIQDPKTFATIVAQAVNVRRRRPPEGGETLALNPGSGVLHLWHCGLGPARGGMAAPYADGYVSVPAVVLRSIKAECLCKCLRGSQ